MNFHRFPPIIEPKTDTDWALYFGIFALIFANFIGFCIYSIVKTQAIVSIVFLSVSIAGFLINIVFMIFKIIKIRRSQVIQDIPNFTLREFNEDVVDHHPL